MRQKGGASNQAANGPQVEVLDRRSPMLNKVKKLGKQHADTLGFFPEGAFDDAADRRMILIARRNEELAGYLLYRAPATKMKAVIVHLCVAPAYRNQGIARLLVEELSERTQHLRGIGLYCRRDYEARFLWPKLGFYPLGDRPGRGKKKTFLTYWWRGHGHRNLFTSLNPPPQADQLSVVIDANIFFDFFSDHDRQSEEAKALQADWLEEFLHLQVNRELYVEIDRKDRRDERKKMQEVAGQFPCTSPDHRRSVEMEGNLVEILGKPESEQDSSDLRQLGQAIAAGADVFVTRDSDLLGASEIISEKFPIQVLRPSDLILTLDKRLDAAAFQPERLSGTNLHKRKVGPKEPDKFRQQFQQFEKHEEKASLSHLIRTAATRSSDTTIRIIEDADNGVAAGFIVDRSKACVHELPLLRHSKHSLSRTLLHHVLLDSIQKAASNESGPAFLVVVTDPMLSEAAQSVLRQLRFVERDDQWLKATLPFVSSTTDLPKHLQKAIDRCPQLDPAYQALLRLMRLAARKVTPDEVASWEADLWPLKIRNSSMPNFLVPIKPVWARNLFDPRLQVQPLLPTEPRLALNRENVYYRAAKPEVLQAPGRILWYVSGQPRLKGTKAVRACSRLLEVEKGTPKELFSKNRRLGVYQFEDLRRIAREDLSTEIMAFRFADTELFDHPIKLQDLTDIVREHEGKKVQLQSPSRIAEKIFFEIYALGKNKV